MMSIKKIEKAVASALAYLKDAVDAEAKGDEDKVMQLTWRAASDLEYGLFLFALKSIKETRSSSWRLPASKQPEIELILTSAKDLLKKQQKVLRQIIRKKLTRKCGLREVSC